MVVVVVVWINKCSCFSSRSGVDSGSRNTVVVVAVVSS